MIFSRKLILSLLYFGISAVNLNSNKKYSFVIHLDEERHLLKENLKDAVDLQLIHHNGIDQQGLASVCSLNQRGVELETQYIHLIRNEDIDSTTFDPMEPINEKQFISMAHINDGILIVDSMLEVFMLKFDYKNLHQDLQIDDIQQDDEYNQPGFASLQWRADMSGVRKSISKRVELPQLVYNSDQNLAILVYTDMGIMFSVAEMESNADSISVSLIQDWIVRVERGWSKSVGKLLFSAVGKDGIDVYYCTDSLVMFIANINSSTIYGDDSAIKLFVKDFEIISSADKTTYTLFILDQNEGILILRTFLNDDFRIVTRLIVDRIGPKEPGVAMDTYDGKTILATYQIGPHYVTYEIRYFQADNSWQTIATYSQTKRVLDVKINQDIGIIQGMNHYQIIFFGAAKGVRNFEMSEPILVHNGGARDFDFFDTRLMTQKKLQYFEGLSVPEEFQNNLMNGFIFDDFILGISKHKFFVSRYKKTTPFINCYTDDPQTLRKQYLYTAYYNTSKCALNGQYSPSDCRLEIDFQIQVVQTVLFADKVMILFIMGIIVSLVFTSIGFMVVIMYRRYLHDKEYMDKTIKQYEVQRRSVKEEDPNMSSNQLQISNRRDD